MLISSPSLSARSSESAPYAIVPSAAAISGNLASSAATACCQAASSAYTVVRSQVNSTGTSVRCGTLTAATMATPFFTLNNVPIITCETSTVTDFLLVTGQANLLSRNFYRVTSDYPTRYFSQQVT